MGQIDELELEFEKIARIREIVRGFRARGRVREEVGYESLVAESEGAGLE